MKKVVSCVVAIALCACSADPGYEPRYEPRESLLVTSDVRPEPPQTATKAIEAPQKLVASLQLCADRFAPRLAGKSETHYAVKYDLNIDDNGTSVKVNDSMIPGTELEACLTNVLENLEIHNSVSSISKMSPKSRSLVGVVQAAAAPIALLPIVLVAGGFTILLGVTLYVVAEAVEDVIEAIRKYRPKPTKNRCLDAAAGGQFLWYELCRAITDPVKAEGCWALAEDGSEEQKRNWCNGVKF